MAEKTPKGADVMETKNFRLEITEMDEAGTFVGVAATYGLLDLGNDIIEPKAFDKTLAERPTVKVLWQHDPREVIGEGAVSDNGREIIVKGKLDMDDPLAVKVYGKLKKKLIDGLSIGYRTVKSTPERIGDKIVRHITELKLWEISFVTFAEQQLSQVFAVKQMDGQDQLEGFTNTWEEIKAGRKISKERAARLRAISDEIQALLAEAGTTEGTQEDTTSAEAATKGSEPEDFHSIASALDSLRADWASAA